jgi:hypothetical protein
MRTLITVLGGTVFAAAAGCASRPVMLHRASDAPIADSSAAWASIDPDHDGTVSFDEAKEQGTIALAQDFGNADGNGDGRVSREEWDAWWPRMDIAPHSPTQERLNRPSTNDAP